MVKSISLLLAHKILKTLGLIKYTLFSISKLLYVSFLCISPSLNLFYSSISNFFSYMLNLFIFTVSHLIMRVFEALNIIHHSDLATFHECLYIIF